MPCSIALLVSEPIDFDSGDLNMLTEHESVQVENLEYSDIGIDGCTTGSYTGAIQNSRRHGFGVASCDNGRKFTGNWKNDQLHGIASLQNCDPIYGGQCKTFTADFTAGKPDCPSDFPTFSWFYTGCVWSGLPYNATYGQAIYFSLVSYTQSPQNYPTWWLQVDETPSYLNIVGQQTAPASNNWLQPQFTRSIIYDGLATMSFQLMTYSEQVFITYAASTDTGYASTHWGDVNTDQTWSLVIADTRGMCVNLYTYVNSEGIQTSAMQNVLSTVASFQSTNGPAASMQAYTDYPYNDYQCWTVLYEYA